MVDENSQKPLANKSSSKLLTTNLFDHRSHSAPKYHAETAADDSYKITIGESRKSINTPKISQSETNLLRSNHFIENLEKAKSDNNILEAHKQLRTVTTDTARQRNFLQGRIGANALLGPKELQRLFSDKSIKIFVSTWNMNGRPPPKDMNDFVLPMKMKTVPEILVFGTQESHPDRYEWEVNLQETLGPTHLLFHSASFGTLHMSIFLHRDLIWYVSIVEEATYSLRPGSSFRTKGALACCFMLFGTSFLFITSHLTAHEEKFSERINDIGRITNSIELPKILPCRHRTKDVTENFDYTFWLGDLNFRLTENRSKILEIYSKNTYPLVTGKENDLLSTDQLNYAIKNKLILSRFNESNILFAPTYKYDPGSQDFDSSSKQRTPAYTDRILYKQSVKRSKPDRDLPGIECVIYDSVPTVLTSDHKPVWGVFKVQLRPGLDSIPLAAGLFKRDVYLEGLKRRTNRIIENSGTTSVCSLQ